LQVDGGTGDAALLTARKLVQSKLYDIEMSLRARWSGTLAVIFHDDQNQLRRLTLFDRNRSTGDCYMSDSVELQRRLCRY